MKTKNILTALALIAASALTTSCEKLVNNALEAAMETVNHNYQDSEKWGKVKTTDLPVLAFHEVELSGAVRLEYTQDSIFSLQVYGNEKAIEAYSIKVDDEELEVTQKDGSGKVNSDTPAITIRISAPYLSEIKGSGASEVIYMSDVTQQQDLDISLAGVGKLTMATLRTQELDITISGAGEANLGNVTAAGDMELRVEGAAKLDGKVAAEKLELKLMGAASGTLDIQTQKTDVVASGASDLTLTGETQTLDLNSAGAASVHKDALKVGSKQ
ncbi:MAG: DUF2807 domain-containing protein [Bacteroidaceae bacterium]|nr:DUF2807 domain-containing protein [Bacteroidaceae bacterium]MBQ9293753.1 DUF2807 domain-containing protein [Bacteroidaceae bacterium]